MLDLNKTQTISNIGKKLDKIGFWFLAAFFILVGAWIVNIFI